MQKKNKNYNRKNPGYTRSWITNLSPFIPLSEQTLLSPEEREKAIKKQRESLNEQATTEQEEQPQDRPVTEEIERLKQEAIAEVNKAHQQLIKDKTPEEITELEETRRQLLADIEAGLLGKELPPVYDPSGTFHQKVSHYDPYAYNVFRKSDNSSLGLLQKAAWRKKTDNIPNWWTVTGLFGEVAAYDYLKNNVLANVANQSFVANASRKKSFDAYKYAQQNTKFIQAPDKKTDMIMTTKANKDISFNHSFQHPAKDSLFGSDVIVNRTNEYKEDTVFVYEVKTISPANKPEQNITYLLRGVGQLLKSEHIKHNKNAVPVLVCDRAAWNTALKSNKQDKILKGVQKLESMGGGLMLISDMNKIAKARQNKTLEYIRENTDEVPQGYY